MTNQVVSFTVAGLWTYSSFSRNRSTLQRMFARLRLTFVKHENPVDFKHLIKAAAFLSLPISATAINTELQQRKPLRGAKVQNKQTRILARKSGSVSTQEKIGLSLCKGNSRTSTQCHDNVPCMKKISDNVPALACKLECDVLRPATDPTKPDPVRMSRSGTQWQGP